MEDYKVFFDDSEQENDEFPSGIPTVSIYENPRGGIHAIVTVDGYLVNVIPHLQLEFSTGDQIIAEAKKGFKNWDEYEEDDFDDQDAWNAQYEIETFPLIVKVHGEEVEYFSEFMGEQGKRLFGKRRRRR